MTGERATAASMLVAIVVLYYFCTKFESAIAKQYANVLFAVVPLLLLHGGLRALGMTEDRGLAEGNDEARPAASAGDRPLAVGLPE